MKDEDAPQSATITYAFLAVILRLTSAQCGVFTLWYSRRAYERSRGEMITMLYEKTLNRKILGAKQPESEQNGDANANGEANGHGNGSANGEADPAAKGVKGLWASMKTLSRNIWSHMRSMFSKKSKTEPKKEEAASMGKILNLMRQVS
jgi:hypothetical protein